MDTTETRITSETGGAKGSKPARLDLIPADSLIELAEHFGHGSDKYPATENGLDNWRNGYPWSLTLAALGRHYMALLNGEDNDPENGRKHAIAIAWHALVLAHWQNTPELGHFDDRQSVREREVRKAEEIEVDPKATCLQLKGVPTGPVTFGPGAVRFAPVGTPIDDMFKFEKARIGDQITSWDQLPEGGVARMRSEGLEVAVVSDGAGQVCYCRSQGVPIPPLSTEFWELVEILAPGEIGPAFKVGDEISTPEQMRALPYGTKLEVQGRPEVRRTWGPSGLQSNNGGGIISDAAWEWYLTYKSYVVTSLPESGK